MGLFVGFYVCGNNVIDNKINVNNNNNSGYQNIIYINLFHSLIAIPQTISIISYLIYLIMYPSKYYKISLPNIIYYIIFIIFYIINILTIIIISNTLKYDTKFQKWK